MAHDLSPEQIEAVQSGHASLVVSAAAGSGKTRVLVARYLKHVVDDGYSADQILTITFTRKAAAEMKRRIVDSLSALELLEQAQIAETGPIQTIHGFCERLLRENAIEARLDPEFEILSESQTDRLLENCIQEVLAWPSEEDQEAFDLIRKLAGKRTYGESASPHGKLEAAIREAIRGWRGTGIACDDLLAAHRNPSTLLARWRQSLLDWAPAEVRSAFDADLSMENFAAKLANAYRSLKKPKPPFIRPSGEFDEEAASQTCGLMQLVCEAWLRFEGRLRTLRKLDFTALEAYAVELLRRSESTRDRIRAQYPVVLVDEAQDLNPVQYRLLSAMGPKTEMFVGDRQQSIYGFRQADVRLFSQKLAQSHSSRLSRNYRSAEGILGFVDRIFSALWEEGYDPMLADSRVAFPGVDLWLQRQSDKLLTAEWIRDVVVERVDGGGRAKDVAVLVRTSRCAIELLHALDQLGVPARVAGGTEQFYARLEVRDLATALEALANGYDNFALAALLRSPFVGLSLDSLVLLRRTNGPEGKRLPLIEALLRVGSSDLDLTPEPAAEEEDAPQAPVPQGRICSEDRKRISEFLAWFEPMRAYADRLAAWEIISELFAKTRYLENLGRRDGAAQKIANVRKLLSLATQEPETGPREFAERIREIQMIRHKEGDAPAEDQDADEVTIMTIHKSKGLEFPVVVLPDTHGRMSKGAKDVEVDPGLKLITTKFGHTSSMFHEWLAWERQQREVEEEWRVVYVALTRAKERLCVVVSPGGGGDRIADRIARLLKFKDSPPPGVSVREAENLQR